jgi:hypothetical protein
MWFILSAFLFSLVSGMIALSQVEAPGLDSGNFTSGNYSEAVSSQATVTDIIGQVFASWGGMLGPLPGWVQLIILAGLTALIIYGVASIWTAIGG